MRTIKELEKELNKIQPYLKVGQDTYQLVSIKQHIEGLDFRYVFAYVKSSVCYYNDAKCLFVVGDMDYFEAMNRFIDQYRELVEEKMITGCVWNGAVLDYDHGHITDCFSSKSLNNINFNKSNKHNK